MAAAVAVDIARSNPHLAIPAVWAAGNMVHNHLQHKYDKYSNTASYLRSKVNSLSEAAGVFGTSGMLPISVLTPEYLVLWYDALTTKLSRDPDSSDGDIKPYFGGEFAEMEIFANLKWSPKIACIFFGFTPQQNVVPLCPSLSFVLQKQKSSKPCVGYYAIGIPKSGSITRILPDASRETATDEKQKEQSDSDDSNLSDVVHKAELASAQVPDTVRYVHQEVSTRTRALRNLLRNVGREVFIQTAFVAKDVSWLPVVANSGVTFVPSSSANNILGGVTVECGGSGINKGDVLLGILDYGFFTATSKRLTYAHSKSFEKKLKKGGNVLVVSVNRHGEPAGLPGEILYGKARAGIRKSDLEQYDACCAQVHMLRQRVEENMQELGDRVQLRQA